MFPGLTAEASKAGSTALSGRRPFRVLHASAGNLFGGVETILITLARLRHLCPEMEPAFALCFEGLLSQQLRSAGVTVHMLGEARISRPWTVWRARRRLRDVLRREAYDMVICHMPWSLAVLGPAVRAGGRRLGFSAHAFHSGRNWLERLARFTSPDVMIANSRFTEAGLKNLFPEVAHGIMHPPVARTQTAMNRIAVRRRHNTADDAVVIVQISRMEPLKGHLLHLEALAQLRDVNSWVYWVCGGAQRPSEQHYVAQVEKRANELGIAERVRFLGQRTDIGELLAAADIFCQPNLSPDSFGIVFIEALWAGLPVVSTAIGGALEIVNDSCGLLVGEGNATELAGALKRLITQPDLRVELGRNGAARAHELCDPAGQMKVLSRLCGFDSGAASE